MTEFLLLFPYAERVSNNITENDANKAERKPKKKISFTVVEKVNTASADISSNARTTAAPRVSTILRTEFRRISLVLTSDTLLIKLLYVSSKLLNKFLFLFYLFPSPSERGGPD